jgi:hypothetical protein
MCEYFQNGTCTSSNKPLLESFHQYSETCFVWGGVVTLYFICVPFPTHLIYSREGPRSFYCCFTVFITQTPPQIPGGPHTSDIDLLLTLISRGPYQMVCHIIVTVIVCTQFGPPANFIYYVQCRIFLACSTGLSKEVWGWSLIDGEIKS